MTENVLGKKRYDSILKKLRIEMLDKMNVLNDEFHPCTWYKDNWMYKDFSIKAGAKGEFGPLPPIEPWRKIR